MMVYQLLALAVVSEVTATFLLKASNGWEKMWFGISAILLYAVAAVLLAFVLKKMNIGLAYAIWSGAGIALVCVVSVLLWQQRFDIYALTGVALIVCGTALITLKSSVVIH